MTISFKTLFVIVLSLTPILVYGQKEWDDVDASKLNWNVSDKVHVYSNSLQKLQFWNYNAETKEDKKNNTWSHERALMGITWDVDFPWRITFRVSNLNNKPDYKYKVADEQAKESWYNGSVYWGFIVGVKHLSGQKMNFKKCYANRKTPNSHYSYTDTYDSYSRKWRSVDSFSYRDIVISFDGKNTITVSAGVKDLQNLLYTFEGCNAISYIEIMAGTAANVLVENFKIQKAAPFAHVIPFIKAGDSKYENKEYWDAAQEYSKAISAGYEDYNVYYKRASSYYCVEFYNNAIDDYTKALEFEKTEDAYLYRGLSKLAKKDVSCMEDLKRGGAKGVALAKEIEGVIGSVEDSNMPQARQEYVSSGTGVVIDSRGYVATNSHVVADASAIDVFITVNGYTSKYSAECILKDKVNDLAILKINDTRYKSLPSVPYGFGMGTKDVGSSVFAMGYPKLSYLGEEIKVTDGIISSKTGYQGDVTTYQISAPIQPGNSGGPLFDSNGYLIGITSSGVQSLQNVGYAIKLPYLVNLIETLPVKLHLPTVNSVAGLSFTDKIKRLAPYVVIIKVK